MTKRRIKRPASRRRPQRKPVIGIAWYTPEEWKRLKSVAADADALDDTHRDWLKNATGHLKWLSQQGFEVIKVLIDVDEWVAWCQKNGKALDGAARSEFTSLKASE